MIRNRLKLSNSAKTVAGGYYGTLKSSTEYSFEITKFSRNCEAPHVWRDGNKEWLTDNSQTHKKNRKEEVRRKIGGNKKIGEMGDREIRGK